VKTLKTYLPCGTKAIAVYDLLPTA